MQIVEHFIPGTIGSIVKLHGCYYAQNWGFGTFFEAKVAGDIAGFATRKIPTDLFLLAIDDVGVAASMILDLNDSDSGQRGAHLRWFIAADRCRGTGIGRKLMGRAVNHAALHSGGKIWLTTFSGLEPARHLYEEFGLRLSPNRKARHGAPKCWSRSSTAKAFREISESPFAASWLCLERER